jgi:uncharacterized protein (TIGR03086 family)
MAQQPSLLDLNPAAQRINDLLTGVTDDQLIAPTPCKDTSVAALLDHLMGLTIAFTNAARKITIPRDPNAPLGAPEPSADNLDRDWRRKLPEQIDELAAAWKAPSAWEGMAEAGGVTLPAEVMGVVAADELVIHGWDLARATGQPFDCDDASARAIIGMLSQFKDRDQGAGFGPIVEVPRDASLLDQAVGLSGRDPQWSPRS